MEIKEWQSAWESRFPKLGERVKSSWFSQLEYIQKAASEAEVNEAGFGQGFRSCACRDRFD